jgi:hypothetical protein
MVVNTAKATNMDKAVSMAKDMAKAVNMDMGVNTVRVASTAMDANQARLSQVKLALVVKQVKARTQFKLAEVRAVK